MWALNGYNLVEGYPKYIHKLGLPKKIRKVDAAVYIGDTGKTLFFTEEDYWRFTPMSIIVYFTVVVQFKSLNLENTNNSVILLDSVSPHHLFALFVTHSYDEATGTMDSGYPRSIEENFPGMDDEVDAAAYHNGILML